ncbi:MAG: NADP(H)-dependent aldo-keto reductase [Burkholderiales bacterium]|nr:NADP(H)-dependent aldo-keto reductase [Burkholderiales bacterium]
MQYRRLGTSELSVSEICLGTMTWGEQNTEEQAHEQLDYAISCGVNFIDAAEMYPVPPRAETQGRTESVLGTWLRRQQRSKLIVATKLTAPGRGFAWVRGGPVAVDRRSVREALEGSLGRLQTDYVDLYQIHWPDRYVPSFGKSFYDPSHERPTVPIQEQLEALGEQVRAGRIRYIGLSNETPWGVMEFVRLAREHALPKVVSIQNAYNLLNRTFEAGLSEVHRHLDVPLLAYSPLAFGHLSGKYLNAALPAGARLTRFPAFGQRYARTNVPEATAEYAALARKAGLSPATMALAFVRSRWFTASTIVGATCMAQLRENIVSAQVTLDEAVLEGIEDIHVRYPHPAL